MLQLALEINKAHSSDVHCEVTVTLANSGIPDSARDMPQQLGEGSRQGDLQNIAWALG